MSQLKWTLQGASFDHFWPHWGFSTYNKGAQTPFFFRRFLLPTLSEIHQQLSLSVEELWVWFFSQGRRTNKRAQRSQESWSGTKLSEPAGVWMRGTGCCKMWQKSGKAQQGGQKFFLSLWKCLSWPLVVRGHRYEWLVPSTSNITYFHIGILA